MEKSGFKELPLVQKVALVGGLVGMVAVPIQVAIDQAERPKSPDVTINPITWLATPISNGLQGIENHFETELRNILDQSSHRSTDSTSIEANP
jgi:hypothetical protein